MKLNILFASIDGGIVRIGQNLPAPVPAVLYIITQQVTGLQFRQIPRELDREDVEISVRKERGISRNRNRALDLAGGDLALLADDDAIYRREYFETIVDTFSRYEDLDVACFRIKTPDHEAEYKEYAEEPFDLHETNRHYISSLEIAFRLESVKRKKIRFDERFGLGSELIQSGEEAVFIFDCLKAGLKVCYFPLYIVEHQAESRTKAAAEYSPERLLFKGAYDARRFGWKAIPAALLDTVRLQGRYKKDEMTAFSYLKERLRGAFYILKQA